MSESSLDALITAATEFFADQYEKPKLYVNEAINPGLGWAPTLHFHASNHLIVAAEVSATPYPAILKLRHAAMTLLREPVAVYCVCPEEEYLKKDNQSEIHDLRAHGYGLITVDDRVIATRRHACIPLIQFIPESDFKQEIEDLPRGWRLRARDSYDKYLVDAVSGVQDISEVLEGLVLSAAKGAAKKGWHKSFSHSLATVLDELSDLQQCKPARAAIGGVRNFVKQYRNPASHYPRNRQQALQKYRDAPHAFRDGLKQIHSFREAMRNIGITLSL